MDSRPLRFRACLRGIVAPALAALFFATAPAARAQFTFASLADSSSPTYSAFSAPSVNPAGLVGFRATLDTGNTGLFTHDGTTTASIALANSSMFSSFSGNISLNAGGTMAFFANLDAGGNGLFKSDGTTTATIALSTDIYSTFSAPWINGVGTVAFFANLDGGGQRTLCRQWNEHDNHRADIRPDLSDLRCAGDRWRGAGALLGEPRRRSGRRALCQRWDDEDGHRADQ